MRIKKGEKTEEVSEKSFIIPVFMGPEVDFYLEHHMTTYNENEMIKIISNFLQRKRKFLDFDKLRRLYVHCFFDKRTFELKEITYVVSPGFITRYSILRNLTEEIKNEGNLSIKKEFKDQINVRRVEIDTHAADYFRLSFSFSSSELKTGQKGNPPKEFYHSSDYIQWRILLSLRFLDDLI